MCTEDLGNGGRSGRLRPVTRCGAGGPASGVTGAILARATIADHFQLTADHVTEFVIRHIPIQPGSATGWHYPHGTVLAVVANGTLIHTGAGCRVGVYRAGQSLVKPSGSDHVHVAVIPARSRLNSM